MKIAFPDSCEMHIDTFECEMELIKQNYFLETGNLNNIWPII